MLTTTIIGSKITEARKKNNLTQTDLANKVNVTSQAIGKWERGESMPDILMFNRIAEVLEVDLNYFSENFEGKVIDVKEETPTPIPNWNMSGGMWVDADFSGIKNLGEKFSGSNIKRSKFIGSEIIGINFAGNYIDKNDFSKSNLSKSTLDGTFLKQNDFTKTNFKDTYFKGTHMQDCDLTNADFTGAIFKGSSLQKNITENTIWNKTSFTGCGFTDMTLEGPITDCVFSDCMYHRLTFKNAILTNTFFKGKTKKLKFENCKADSITYAFLKNGKSDMKGIELI